MGALNCLPNYTLLIPQGPKNAIFAWQITKKVITWLNFLVIQSKNKNLQTFAQKFTLDINSTKDALENGSKSTMPVLCAERVLANAAKQKA